MIERKKWKQYSYSYDTILKDCKEDLGRDSVTAEESLRYILGDSDGWSSSDYVIYKYEHPTKRRFIQRLNFVWVWPLFVISIPFQWLLKGDLGVSRNSRIGRVIDWLIRFDR